MRRIVGVGDFEQTPNKNHPSYSRPCTSGTTHVQYSRPCTNGTFLLGSSSKEASSALFSRQKVQEGKMEETAKHKTNQNRIQFSEASCTRPGHPPIDGSKGREANWMYKGDAILLESAPGVNILVSNQPIVPSPMTIPGPSE